MPIGIIGLLLMLRVPANVGGLADRSTRFDPVGFLLLGVGLTAALYGATEGTAAGLGQARLLRATRGGRAAPRDLHGVGASAGPSRGQRRHAPASGFGHRAGAAGAVLGGHLRHGIPAAIFTQEVQGHTAPRDRARAAAAGESSWGLGTYVGQKLTGIVPLKLMVILGFAILADLERLPDLPRARTPRCG
ncbi:MAG: hypothetical protein WDM88_05910 [Galbitalea sp.]